jgi:hypothetical protein
MMPSFSSWLVMSNLEVPIGKLKRVLLPFFLADVFLGLGFCLLPFMGVWVVRRTAAIGHQCCFFCLHIREALQEAPHNKANSKFKKFKFKIQIPNDEANFTNLNSQAP